MSTNSPFSFMALLAVLSLIGMQLKNGIVLVEEIKRLKEQEERDAWIIRELNLGLYHKLNIQNSTIKLFMQNGMPYQIQLCVGPGTQHSPEVLKEQIKNALDNMSIQSRWQRFASPINRLTDKQLDYLVDLDGKDRAAWCASIIANDDERGIGLARYIKLKDENNVAEFALTLVDEFQGQGIGYELLKKLLKTARNNNLEKLRGYVLPSNKHMLSLCQRFDASFHTDDASFVIVDILVTTNSGRK